MIDYLEYSKALTRAEALGGVKYHNRRFGVMFTCFGSKEEMQDAIAKLVAESEAKGE
jgi:hypothetical protein